MATVKPISTPSSSGAPIDVDARALNAAMAYESVFVPALFADWPDSVIAAADIGPGHRVLDIACGTGALTRRLPAIVGDAPTPIGLDIDPGMLAAARQLKPGIDWRQGDAVSLPIDSGCIDRVTCQFGLMFFSDRLQALREMVRVLVPGGCVGIAVWDGLARNPGFDTKVDILQRVASQAAADALRAPFCLGDTEALYEKMDAAGFRDIHVRTREGSTTFNTVHEFVDAEVRGWLPVMGVHLDERVIAAVHAECEQAFASARDPADGRLSFSTSAHIISATAG